MPEEMYLSEEDEEILDEVWKEIEDEDEDDEDGYIPLSTDLHGRQHAPAGSEKGGQFISEFTIHHEEKRIKEYDTPRETPLNPKPPTPTPIPGAKPRYVIIEQHKIAVKKAIEKFKLTRIPTDQEKEAARLGMEKDGARKFRKSLVGNTRNRRDRRNKLLTEFGDGKECPCIYCGVVLTHGTLEQDKVYHLREGGRYRTPNLIPACGDCNKKRGDTPFTEAIKKAVSYVRHREETTR